MSELEFAPGATFGERLRRHRERAGMSRPVLGGLVGRSDGWVKALETDRLLTPRLPMLIRLAQVLGITDLADLTGRQELTLASYVKATHDALPAVSDALTTYRLNGDGEQVTADQLTALVAQAWALWHGSRNQRTAIATVLPGLVDQARDTARALDGTDGRRAKANLAQVYHLAQLYLSFQPRPELVYLTGDRGMLAAQDADDPVAIAAAAWYVNHVYRDAGERHDARIQLAHDAARELRPEDAGEHLALWGLLQLAISLSYAKSGRDGDAWRHWDEARRAADVLGEDYAHSWLIFGRGIVDAYAITMHADLMRGSDAIQQADRVDVDAIPSATRRSFHTIETARAYSLRREPVATLALLRRGHEISPDTARFNLFTQSAVLDLAQNGGATVRRDAADLAAKIGVSA